MPDLRLQACILLLPELELHALNLPLLPQAIYHSAELGEFRLSAVGSIAFSGRGHGRVSNLADAGNLRADI